MCYIEEEEEEEASGATLWKLTFLGHCISRARLSSRSWEMGSTRLRKAAFLYRMSFSEEPSRPRS